jgi:cell division septation protein DedD
MASGGRRGAGERVLESKHVIGLFMLMLVFSAVFFTLGYVMGRNQYDGQVRASTVPHSASDSVVPKKIENKTDPTPKHPSGAPTVTETPSLDSEWGTGAADKPNTEEHLKPVLPPAASSNPKSSAPASGNARPVLNGDAPRSAQMSAGYTLQVSAVRRESEAMDLARRLQRKKFPAFVLSPQGNKYYRVQVGPFADLKSAQAAKKGLENAGFRAIVKHG